MKPKKILYVITRGEWGGAQRYVFDLATNLSTEFSAQGGPASGWEVAVAVGEPDEKKDLQNKIQNTNKNIQIVQLKYLRRSILPWHDFLAIFELAGLFRKIKPNIIHLNSSKAGIIGSLAKLLLTPYSLLLIYTVHGWVFNEALNKIKKKIYTFLEKQTARWKDKIIVLSEEDKALGIKNEISPDKLTLIPLGLAPINFLNKAEARAAIFEHANITLPDNKLLFGTIANLYQNKGVDILVEAVSAKKDDLRKEKACFIVIGDGPERKKIEYLINKYSIGDLIILTGFIADAQKLLRGFDGIIIPSRKEGLPYVALEAEQAGIPILASAVGGIPTLARSTSNIILFDPFTNNGLEQTLEKFISNTRQIRFDNKMGAGRFTLGEMIGKTTSLYESLLH